ncbi:hypothetical protein [Paenibacillus pinistramenti]|uniref:hypothetical protein n=1 Tax=Paenibacillus pinistramenti TaxID=1768003 RepID=UPI001109BDFA|nr:hypothetical protein [Paenibacillus pinistramenti]
MEPVVEQLQAERAGSKDVVYQTFQICGCPVLLALISSIVDNAVVNRGMIPNNSRGIRRSSRSRWPPNAG